MNYLYLAIFGLLLLILCFYLRIRHTFFHSYFGIDNWYWLLSAETYKTNRRIPLSLPFFMLEIDEQWYPPVFTLFLSLFSLKFLKNKGYLISPAVDCMQMIFVYLLAYISFCDLQLAVVSGLVYSGIPFLINYNTGLNPRGLGSLLLSFLMIFLYRYQTKPHLYFMLMIIIIGICILLLHKMTSQLLFFILISLAIWNQNMVYLYILIGLILGAFIFSKGFYVKTLRSHWDIISFWHRNRDHLNAHQFYESPLYKKQGFNSTVFHKKGLRGVINHVSMLFFANPFVMGAIVYCLLYRETLSSFSWFLFKWCLLTEILIFATTFIPHIRCLGAGLLYTYFSALPAAYLVSESITSSGTGFIYIIGLPSIFAIIKITRIYRQIRRSITQGIDNDTIITFDFLKNSSIDKIACFPFNLSDAVAYFSRKKVLSGGHTFGFYKNLEEYFPLIRLKIEEILKKYDVKHILVDRRYIHITDIIEDHDSLIPLFHCKNYYIYEITPLKVVC